MESNEKSLKQFKGKVIRVRLDSGFKAEGKVITRKGQIVLETSDTFYYEPAIIEIIS